MELIRIQPGSRSTALRRLMEGNRGTSSYHLTVLERMKAVHVERERRMTRYFPKDDETSNAPLFAFLLRGRVLEVVKAIIDKPGITQHELTRDLDISRKVFHDYVSKLVKDGLLRQGRATRRMEYFPADRLVAVVGELERRTPGLDDKSQSQGPAQGGGPS